MALVCPTAKRIVTLSADCFTVMVINRFLSLCTNCRARIAVFWQSESLIHRTDVDRFSWMVVDWWLNGDVDRWWSSTIDRPWILCLISILKISVSCCNESGVVDSSVGRLWPHKSDWIIVDIMIYQCETQLIGLHVANCSYNSHESSPK